MKGTPRHSGAMKLHLNLCIQVQRCCELWCNRNNSAVHGISGGLIMQGAAFTTALGSVPLHGWSLASHVCTRIHIRVCITETWKYFSMHLARKCNRALSCIRVRAAVEHRGKVSPLNQASLSWSYLHGCKVSH